VSFLFFIFTEPALAKMNRAPADPALPVPASYKKARGIAGDVRDVQKWLKEGLCEPAISDSPIEEIYSTIKKIERLTPER
jgi:hypothetical protein